MNKQDIIETMAAEAGISKAKAKLALQGFTQGVQDALSTGNTVQLVGFGTFSVSERKARTGRNPKTGETLQIPAKNVVKFKAGKGLDDAVN